MDEFEEVKAVIRDSDTKGPFPIRDGARFYLLEEVRKRYGVNNWIGVLHGDEMYTRDPRPFLKMINPYLMPVVMVRLCHFFLHTTDRGKWSDIAGEPVEDRVTHYMWPGDWEKRFFYDTGKFQYDPACHGLVVPYASAFRKSLDNFVIKQYNYRTPEQMHARAAQRIGSNWQKNHYEHIKEESLFFVDSLHVPGYEPCGPENLSTADERKWSRPKSIKTEPLLSCAPMARPVFVGGINDSDVEHAASLLCGHPELVSVGENTEFLTGRNGLLELLEPADKTGYRQLLKTLSGKKEIVGRLQTLGEESCRMELEHLARLWSDSTFSWSDKKSAIRDLVHFLFDRSAVSGGAVGWIEHSPDNIFWASRLLEVFEDGYFIFIMSEPGNISGRLSRKYSGPPEQANAFHNERFDRWRQVREMIAAQTLENRLIEIGYNDVISSQSGSVKNILYRMGICHDISLRRDVGMEMEN
jgi:hypothetical protein